MIRDRARPRVALVLALTLVSAALSLGSPRFATAAGSDSCTGGSLQPNGLSEQFQSDGTSYNIYLNGYVTPAVAAGSLRVDVQLVTYIGSTTIGTAGTDGYGHYYWAGTLPQSTFGLNGPGAWTTLYLKFLIPFQPDVSTCSLVATYLAPPSQPTPVPLPTPVPVPTVGPVPTPQPLPGPIPTIFTINAGQQLTITQAGAAGTDVQFETSSDLTTWSWLGPRLTIPASGPASYTFTPSQTAYYRTYFYSTGTATNPVRGVVLPAPTPKPTTPPTSVATIYTVALGESVTVTGHATPGTSVVLESSLDNVLWNALASAMADAGGTASFTYRPATNLFLRIAADGVNNASAAVRGVVRQVAILRPTGSGKTTIVRRGATVVIALTIRPQTGASASARFRIYQWTGSSWTMLTERRANADTTGVARLAWTFTNRGRWYVRAIADPTVYNANSSWSQVERYDVR